MKKQKPITTYASDLEIIIQAAKLFSEVSSKIMPSEQAMNAFSAYHKIYAPMLRNYQEIRFLYLTVYKWKQETRVY